MSEPKVNYNRLANCHNPHQGDMKKVLCVCSAGLLRSPTIAWVLSNSPFNFNTRAAGISREYALIHADIALIEWADEIICAEKEHADYIREQLSHIQITNQKKPVYVLDLPDEFKTRDPELVNIITTKAKKIYKI
jgi:predicted protein tyrosine phosphatase